MGIHVVEQRLITQAATPGLELPDPSVGVIDFLRLIRGHAGDPPPAERPIAVHGLGRMLAAADETQRDGLAAGTRRLLHEGKGYFEWKRIPIVFVVDGELGSALADEGLRVRQQGRTVALDRVLGRRFDPVGDSAGWWWGPQLG